MEMPRRFPSRAGRGIYPVFLILCLFLLAPNTASAGTVYGNVNADGGTMPTTIRFVDEESGEAIPAELDSGGSYEVTLAPGQYTIESDRGSVSPESVTVFHGPKQLDISVGG